jgi:hypothetical protein
MEGPRRELGNVEEAWNGTIPNTRQDSVGKPRQWSHSGVTKNGSKS